MLAGRIFIENMTNIFFRVFYLQYLSFFCFCLPNEKLASSTTSHFFFIHKNSRRGDDAREIQKSVINTICIVEKNTLHDVYLSY